MANSDIDILMITYNRPEYTRLSLKRLLTTCDESMRVWVWHNGSDEETLGIVKSFRNHPRFFKFHHSIENKKLNEPTNWLWTHAKGDFFGKVDDDCLMPMGWANKLRQAHVDVPEFGVLGCWHFPEEDFVPDVAKKKIKTFQREHQIMQNCWVGGSGYIMKSRCARTIGVLRPKHSFTEYCIKLAAKGWINGWYYPFLYQEHMDDPRSPNTLLKSDNDLKKYLPLTAQNFGINTLEEWLQFLRNEAVVAQAANINPKHYVGWGSKLNRLSKKIFR
ncbi:MAG: glycosyltransferase family 2 protein [Sedimentisphaerales bacterium]|nr:glycosyltransferase family 2 protein [Sedimentisphaerales bacterium]